jgi:alanine racemase
VEALSDSEIAGGILKIDLGALGRNYLALKRLCVPAEVAAVVKADAYGLGAEHVAKTLHALGCRRFFVALPDEGRKLRPSVPAAQIFVLSGPRSAAVWPLFREHNLTPVLNSTTDIASCRQFARSRLPVAIHVDTGMNRLGLTVAEAVAFAKDNALTGALTPVLVLSHLACADEPEHALNARQLESFQAVESAFSESDSSLANSAGIMLGERYLFDLVRPGIALYGGSPVVSGDNPMLPVVTLEARILQIRTARAGETVSYGATEVLRRDTLIAVASIGYADGLPRGLSGAGVPMRQTVAAGGCGHLHGRRVPILGRVTMDLTLFDVTDLGIGAVRVGDHIELFGPNIGIEDAAASAGTISYELLTRLGRRYHRHYVGSPAST